GAFRLPTGYSQLYLWDGSTGKRTATSDKLPQFITRVALRADGQLAAFATESPRGVWVWEPGNGKIRQLSSKGEDLTTVLGLAFSPDGKHVNVWLEEDRTLRGERWDVATGRKISTFRFAISHSAVVAPGGLTAAAIAGSGDLQLHDL